MELTELLERCAAAPDTALAGEILSLLATASVYVPAAADKRVVPMQGNLMGLRPDTIPVGEGRCLFPVFSHTSQVPDDYGERFTFLHLPFGEFAKAAAADPGFAGILLDPFTHRFLLAGKEG